MIIPKGDYIAFDCETNGLDPWNGDRPFAWSFCNFYGETGYVEFDVDPFTRRVIYDGRIEEIKRFLVNPKIRKTGHNLKFDVRHSELALGVVVQGVANETMFKARTARPDEKTLALKDLSQKYHGVGKDDESDLHAAVKSARLVGKKHGWNIKKGETGAFKADYWILRALVKAGLDHLLLGKHPNLAGACEKYARLDAVRTMMLDRLYDPILEENGLMETYQREMRLWPIVYDMETRGVKIDLERNAREIKLCEHELKYHREMIVKTFGEFNKQVSDHKLRKYLFGAKKEGGLALPVNPDRLTDKTKQPSVAREVLTEYEDDVPAIKHLILYDKNYKAHGTYFSTYAIKAAIDSILHCTFDQIGAITGRFSCRDPNLQNVPKRALPGEVMKRVRAPFGPRPGYRWLHLDYKSIEARVFAELSGDPDMLRVFEEGGDVYVELVKRIAQILGLKVSELDGLFPHKSGARDMCKVIFLAWIYGEGAEKMAKQTGLPIVQAMKLVAALKEAYPGAQPFMWRMQSEAKKSHHVINPYGRVIPIPPPFWDYKKKEWIKFHYKATNYLIQSTAADLMKNAMLRVADFLRSRPDIDCHLVMTIHDELVFEVAEVDFTWATIQALQYQMEDRDNIFQDVAILTDAAMTTKNWDEPTKLKVPSRRYELV